MDSLTSLTVMSNSFAISSAEGGRSLDCSNNAYILLILLIEPILFNGKRTIRDCSANADKIDWRIHQTAYEINLKPRVSSNLFAALIKPKLPSLIKSGSVKP